MATAEKLSTALQNGEGVILTPPLGTRLHTIRPRYDLVKKNLRGTLSAFRIKSAGITRKFLNEESDSSRVYKALTSDKNHGDQTTNGYTEFLLQGTSLNFQEKSQVITTAGDNDVVYYFGRTPTQLVIQGTLIDDADNDWFTDFVTAYNTILRGTQLARNFEVIELLTPSVRYVGTIMNLAINQNSQVEQIVPFSMTLLLKEVTPIKVNAWGKDLSQNSDKFSEVIWANYDQMPGVASNQYQLPTLYTTNEEARREENESYYRSYYAARGLEVPPELLGPQPATLGDSLPTEKPTSSSSEYVSLVSTVRSNVLDSIKSIENSILSTAGAGASFVSDLATLTSSPLLGLQDAFNAVTSVINAAESATDQLADSIMAPYNQLLSTESAFKNMVGTITAFPESISETIARHMGDDTYGIPTFAGGKAVSSADAIALLRDANQRDPARVPRVGVPTTAESSDEAATISF